jgi:hypothetical protein
VAGVVAALEANDDISILRKEVGDLPLALVAPLGTNDDRGGNVCGSLLRGSEDRAKEGVLGP